MRKLLVFLLTFFIATILLASFHFSPLQIQQAKADTIIPESYVYVINNQNPGTWTNPTYAYNNVTSNGATKAFTGVGYSGYLVLNLSSVTIGTKIRYWVGRSNTAITTMQIDVANQTGAWVNVFSATPTYSAYANATIPQSTYTAMRFRFYNTGTTSRTATIYEVQAVNASITIPNYRVNVTLDKVYVLRNQDLNVTVQGNFSSALVEFWQGTSLIASYNQDANTSRLIPINATYPYGDYTVKVSAGYDSSSTWVTVLDVSSWTPTNFPYMRNFQNANYTIFANGTIQVVQANDALNIDLSTLRTLVSLYNLDVATYYNSMCFLIRFSKDSIAIDITFAFIYYGCKFIVNGTLDQARNFNFEIANPSTLRNLFDKVKQGILVFDYGDLRRMHQTFTYSNGVLSLSLPQTFVFDPTIFSDGFEGNFNAWDGTYIQGTKGNIEISSSNPHHGSYNAYAYFNATWGVHQTCYEQFSVNGLATSYARIYVKFNTLPSYSNAIFYVLTLGVDYWQWNTVSIGVLRSGTAEKWQVRYLNTTYMTSSISSPAPTTGVWYCVEIEAVISHTAGEANCWIDGTQQFALTGCVNDANGNTGWVRAGLDLCDNIGSAVYPDVYLDCCVVDSAYIGPEVTSVSYIADLSQSTSTTWNCLIQSNFHAVTSKSFTSAWSSPIQWNIIATLSQSVSTTWNVLAQWNALVTLSQSLTTTWNTLIHWSSLVTLSQSVSATWSILTRWAALATLSQTFTTTWSILAQTNFNILATLTSTFSWIVNIIQAVISPTNYAVDLSLSITSSWIINTWTGIQHIVDLTVNVVTSWATNLIMPIQMTATEAAAIGIAFSIIVLAICVGLIYARRRNV